MADNGTLDLRFFVLAHCPNHAQFHISSMVAQSMQMCVIAVGTIKHKLETVDAPFCLSLQRGVTNTCAVGRSATTVKVLTC